MASDFRAATLAASERVLDGRGHGVPAAANIQGGRRKRASCRGRRYSAGTAWLHIPLSTRMRPLSRGCLTMVGGRKVGARPQPEEGPARRCRANRGSALCQYPALHILRHLQSHQVHYGRRHIQQAEVSDFAQRFYA